eukprot:TRINITY_DN8361_c0_g1_i1.p1 TRINITY_DN8361_c0_g1~~TRINITY_DN8361_c0_g1_i1.p1  ORF type:complete len:278 (+),score=55.90 TRINITY_DN8361_c0_g1_i1:58-891(+)
MSSPTASTHTPRALCLERLRSHRGAFAAFLDSLNTRLSVGDESANQPSVAAPNAQTGSLTGPNAPSNTSVASGSAPPQGALLASVVAATQSLSPVLTSFQPIAQAAKSTPSLASSSLAYGSPDPTLADFLNADDLLRSAILDLKKQTAAYEENQTLKAELGKREELLRHTTRQLQDIAEVLSESIYQTKKRLQSIQRARSNAPSLHDIIGYGHRVSFEQPMRENNNMLNELHASEWGRLNQLDEPDLPTQAMAAETEEVLITHAMEDEEDENDDDAW